MRAVLFLTSRYLAYNKGKTLILTGCITILMLLPVSFNLLVNHYHRVLLERAEATPALVGVKGNRYDLVLKSLYNYTQYTDAVRMSDAEVIADNDYGLPIPLHIRFSAQKFHETGKSIQKAPTAALVGTQLAYFEFRGLRIREGRLPLYLGDVVLGAGAAEALDVKAGDYLLTTPTSAYDQALSFQLKMPVVGSFEAMGTPDDQVVFADLKTTWVVEGIGHGHEDVLALEDSALIDRQRSVDTNIVTTSQILQYQEITRENRKSFHFHGDKGEYPITSILVLPRDRKQNTLARAYYDLHPTRSYLVPVEVMGELMGFVFKVRQFINANYFLIMSSALFLVGMIFLLSYKLRRREMETLDKLGCSKSMERGMLITEIFVVLVLSSVASAGCSAALVYFSKDLLGLLMG